MIKNSAPGVFEKLSDVLLDKGLIDEQTAEQIALKRLKTGQDEEEIIRTMRLVSDRELIEAKAVYLRIPFVDLEDIGFSPEALSFVPRSVAEKYRIVPYGFDSKDLVLMVAMVNPLDLETIEFIEKKSGLKVKAAMGLKKQIDFFIREKYERERGITSEVSKALSERKKDEKIVVKSKSEKVSAEAPVARIVKTILEFAIKARASDVHIEPQESSVRVRYRIDGILQEKYLLPRNVHDAVVSRIKILSGLKIDEKRVPQDGRFFFSVDDKDVDLRVSTLPITYGEKVVMRLLQKSQKVPSLPDLGLRGRALRNFMDAIERPHGIIVVCGPTGSGKTTTLYSALNIVSTSKVNVSTIEDPVEYQIDGVNQVQVNNQAGLTFATALRSFLRQDPNIIMVGEIRDTETAELAINAALTGHLVFSTLHTNDASGAPPRMIDMEVEPFLLVSSLSCVVAQRVLRRVCKDCSELVPVDDMLESTLREALGSIYDAVVDKWKKEGKEMMIPRINGCDKCNKTGYFGRIAIYEVMPITEKIGKMIIEKSPASEIQKEAMRSGMLTMKQDGYVKVLEGVTTIEEVHRVAEY
ncbi:GspE/PulE family protein [Patescibacteria group bacterium]|nr:GspE/PulE family protein [Patescibacteria group bacterium]MCG2702690.1 GspE/PulE family protein [Candidatus Parcubacteria bacterium]MBU4265305.1 GspE/PulE family protein [Patescibacteria group bacterium]MBU4389990.1 GspE/PulE family protein [Patescibacteria group bacterium]MBU4396818.1 GspE/PulE family protein [Patescibacteria group bacterium]